MIKGKQHNAGILFIAQGSITDLANPGAAERLNSMYEPAQH